MVVVVVVVAAVGEMVCSFEVSAGVSAGVPVVSMALGALKCVYLADKTRTGVLVLLMGCRVLVYITYLVSRGCVVRVDLAAAVLASWELLC